MLDDTAEKLNAHGGTSSCVTNDNDIVTLKTYQPNAQLGLKERRTSRYCRATQIAAASASVRVILHV
jgi:hypothetical protein